MFSYLSNGRKLFSPNTKASQLSCLEGFKALTVMWIVLSHVYAFQVTAPNFCLGNIIQVYFLYTLTFSIFD